MAQDRNNRRPSAQSGSSRPWPAESQIGKEPPVRTLRSSEQINRIRERGNQQRQAAGSSHEALHPSASGPIGSRPVAQQPNRSAAPAKRQRPSAAQQPRVVKQGSSKRAVAPSRRTQAGVSGSFRAQTGPLPKQAPAAVPFDSSSIQGMEAKKPHFAKPLLIVVAVALVLALGYGVDQLMNSDKIYSGVTIGDVVVGGMTKEEASNAVSGEYSQRVSSNSAVFFTSQENLENPKVSDTDANIEEQISYEESLENRTQWTVNAAQLEGELNIDSLVNSAYEVGRSDGGVFARIASAVSGHAVDLACTFNSKLVDELSGQMTETVGTKRVNCNIKVKEGVASVTSGNDGNEVTSEWLEGKLNEALLGPDASKSYVLEPEYMPLQINEEQAQKVADTVNNSISQGAQFTYGDQSWNASKEDLGSWVTTTVEGEGANCKLVPSFKEQKAKAGLLSSLHASFEDESLAVTFEVGKKGKVTVSSNAKGTAPMAGDAVEEMNKSFFTSTERTEAPTIEVSSTEIPGTMSLSDAKSYGVVSEISSFTTQYSSGNEARVHNIHTAADLLDKSVAKANNGTWSFNDIAGEATEDKGYQSAGAIVGGEYSDAVGGGICQVATTVFNAIYTAGYPVTERHNHTLYIDSYPEGRDAAIAYPDMNLVWQNDTSSDVLLTMDYTDSSVTCSLWGVNPGYKVSTEYGEWQEGAEYSTTYKTDDTVASGTEYVETTGVNGSSITIVRTVTDKDGKTLHKDEFESNYSPKNKVVVKGTG